MIIIVEVEVVKTRSDMWESTINSTEWFTSTKTNLSQINTSNTYSAAENKIKSTIRKDKVKISHLINLFKEWEADRIKRAVKLEIKTRRNNQVLTKI